MPQSSSRPESDRNLLFGILAVQFNFISRDDLVSGMNSWALEKSKSLGQIMIEQGRLSPEQVQTLEALIAQQLKAHGDDPVRGLQAVKALTTAASLLTRITDDDVQASLGHLVGEGSTVSYPTDADANSYEARSGVVPSGPGRYRRLRPHASGGLGEVFVALDTELHREVALKEIKAKYADNEGSRLRFLREAEITGGLEHPGIVPVYGLGAYPDGRPYYAMRFIRGGSLREAIDGFHAADKSGRNASERSLSFRQLLRRFVDVCNAVAYAHSRGVLHRDLKPANVMLGKFGETLVVDWGLAKAGVESGLPDGSLSAEPALHASPADDRQATRAGALVGTIAYMSPEQAAGRLDLLGPASDIYGLGATLYVLLTGERLFSGKDAADALAKIQQGRFAPPRAVKLDTPPALDAICRKAMALEPKDRYATALDLAADLEHWLADEPVAAYPEPWTVRAGRLARRHRTKLVAAGVLMASAIVALSVSTGLVVAEQQETEKQRQVAVRNYEISRKQSFDIITLIETSEPEFASVPALHDRRNELLTTAANACRQFLLQEPDDVELQKRAAQIYRYTANFHRLTNEIKLAEGLYGEAIALRERLMAQFPEEELLLADTLRDQASLRIKQGQLREAAEKFNNSLEIAVRLKQDEKSAPYRRVEGLARMNLAGIEYRQGKHEKAGATENARQAEELFRSLMDGKPAERIPYDPVLLASSLNLVAMMERDAGKPETAEKKHKEALALLGELRKKFLKTVNEADVLHFEAECRGQQSKTWARIGSPNHLANAEKNIDGAITNLGILARNYPKIPIYQESIAAAHNERGQIRKQRAMQTEFQMRLAKSKEEILELQRARIAHLQDARKDFDKARELHSELLKKFPELPELQWELANSYAGLGQIALQLKDQEPMSFFTQAEAERQAALGKSPEDSRYQRVLDDFLKNPRR